MVQIGVEVINIIAQLFTSSTVKRVWFASQVLVQHLRKTNLKQGFVWHWIVQVCYSNKMLTMHSRNTQKIFWCSVDWCKTSQLQWCSHSRAKRFWSTGPVTAELFLVLFWHILSALLTGANHHNSTGVLTQWSEKVLINWSSNEHWKAGTESD